jgi:tripeptide aminopeptidase
MDTLQEKLLHRFEEYISFNTQSNEANAQASPSTPGQIVLARHLADQLKALGLTDVSLDGHGYVMATLPANNGKEGPVIGFISHMDTAPDAPGGPVKPVLVRNYDGKDIVLNKEQGILFSTRDFPEVLQYRGQDILFTDGTTLLGADDKAGITAIVTAAEYLLAHPEVKHGPLRLGFTPDEEVGRGTRYFDVEKFGADFAYTVDGGELGGLEYENFNAANAVITFHGRSVHTGSAKGKMKNALTLAGEWQAMLPAGGKAGIHRRPGRVLPCVQHPGQCGNLSHGHADSGSPQGKIPGPEGTAGKNGGVFQCQIRSRQRGSKLP